MVGLEINTSFSLFDISFDGFIRTDNGDLLVQSRTSETPSLLELLQTIAPQLEMPSDFDAQLTNILFGMRINSKSSGEKELNFLLEASLLSAINFPIIDSSRINISKLQLSFQKKEMNGTAFNLKAHVFIDIVSQNPFLELFPDLCLEVEYQSERLIFKGIIGDEKSVGLDQLRKALIPDIEWPWDLNIKLKNSKFTIAVKNSPISGREYSFNLEANIESGSLNNESFQSQLQLQKLHFNYSKSTNSERKTELNFGVTASASLSNLLEIRNLNFDFEYDYNPKKRRGEWNLKAQMLVQALDRWMHFKAKTTLSKKDQVLSFLFNADKPVVHASCFNHIQNTSGLAIITALNKGIAPDNHQLELAKIPPKVFSTLKNSFSSTQLVEIQNEIEKARCSKEPLINIPDVLNNNLPLLNISPERFEIKLQRQNKRFNRLDLAFGSSLTLHNTLNQQTPLFSIRKGILCTGYDTVHKRFYISYSADSFKVKPLALIAQLPGIQSGLISAFGETNENHPKTSALLSMMEIQPRGFHFFKSSQSYDFKGGIRLVLNDGLRTIDKDLFTFFESVFPKVGKQRFIEGELGYNSQQGLAFILRNNNGIEIPNLLEKIAKKIDPTFKANFKKSTGIDLEKGLDIGNSFILLDRVRFFLGKKIEMDVRLAFGLPSKLNDRLFHSQSKLHGLINCYDREKIIQKAHEENTPNFKKSEIDDGLLRASLKFGTDGISGQLDQFNLFNLNKIAKEYEGLFTETPNGVRINLNALTNESEDEFGEIEIDKIEFKLNFKTGAFAIGGGVKILSNQFRIPVSPLLKKIIAFLPDEEIKDKFTALSDKFTDSISLKSINFYDAERDELSIDELLDFFRQFLLKEHQDIPLLPEAFSKTIKNASGYISSLLPKRLLEYFSIDIPPGFTFNLEITADSSFSFDLDVIEPTKRQKELGFSDHLQLLIPDVGFPPGGLFGLRITKLGAGTALFNQAIRLDLSAELAIFKYTDLIAGAGLELVKKARPNDQNLNHIFPDVRTFGIEYIAEKVVLLIFPQTTVPIPVPVFFDKLGFYAAGMEGTLADISIGFSKPEINIKQALEAIGNLSLFFVNKNQALPVKYYGRSFSKEDQIEKGILPHFSVGPIYAELPGIIGNENADGGEKKKISLGFRDQIYLNPTDLVGLLANAAKFSLLSIIDKTNYTIKIDEKRSEPPLNYLIKYLPLNQRIGSKAISLFGIFQGNFTWVLCTPNEYLDQAIPILSKKHSKNEGHKRQYKAQLLELAPKTDSWTSSVQGIVTSVSGELKISSVFRIKAALISSLTFEDGLYSKTGLMASLGYPTKRKLLEMKLLGGFEINKDNPHLQGTGSLNILDQPFLSGSYFLSVNHFTFEGETGSSQLPIHTRVSLKGVFTQDLFHLKGSSKIKLFFFKLQGEVEAYVDKQRQFFKAAGNMSFLNSNWSVGIFSSIDQSLEEANLGVYIKGDLFDLAHLSLEGAVNNYRNRISVSGNGKISLCGQNVIALAFRYQNDTFQLIQGEVDLFPTIPKDILNFSGKVKGYLKKDDLNLSGSLKAKVMGFTLSDTHFVLEKQGIDISGKLFEKEFKLSVNESKDTLLLKGQMEPLSVGPLQLTGIQKIDRQKQNKLQGPMVSIAENQFFLEAKALFLGIENQVQVNLSDQEFAIQFTGKFLGVTSGQLTVIGSQLLENSMLRVQGVIYPEAFVSKIEEEIIAIAGKVIKTLKDAREKVEKAKEHAFKAARAVHDNVKAQVEKLNQEYEKAKGELEKAKSVVSSLDNDIKRLEGEVKSLEREIEQKKDWTNQGPWWEKPWRWAEFLRKAAELGIRIGGIKTAILGLKALMETANIGLRAAQEVLSSLQKVGNIAIDLVDVALIELKKQADEFLIGVSFALDQLEEKVGEFENWAKKVSEVRENLLSIHSINLDSNLDRLQNKLLVVADITVMGERREIAAGFDLTNPSVFIKSLADNIKNGLASPRQMCIDGRQSGLPSLTLCKKLLSAFPEIQAIQLGLIMKHADYSIEDIALSLKWLKDQKNIRNQEIIKALRIANEYQYEKK